MSDLNDIGDDLKGAVELEPIVEGVEKIAKFATEKARKTEEKVETVAQNLGNQIKSIDEKVEKMAGDLVDRMDTVLKRSSAINRLRFGQDDMSSLRDAIPAKYKGNLGAYEAEARNWQKESQFSDASVVAATDAWFKMATKLQLRRFDEDREANLREFRALNDRMEQIHKATLVGNTDAQGGYGVPDIVGNEVLKIIRDGSDIYNRARQFMMTSDTLNLPDESTAVTIYWSNAAGTQGQALTEGNPAFGQKQLLARKLIGRSTFSLELLEDSNVAILPFLQSCFAEKMGGELDLQAMEGTGSPFTGVSGATSVNDCARTNGTTGVSLTYNSTASTAASLVQIFTKAAERYTRDQGLFVCNPGVYGQIIGLVDNNGQPVVRLGTVEGQPNNTLFGRPIIVSNRLPNTTVGAGTNSVGSLYFGPPSALLFGVRSGFRWEVSDQVSWASYCADARMVGRFAYVVGVPTAWAKQAAIRV